MRITESQLRRIVRQEILRESAMPTGDLQQALEKAGMSVVGGVGGRGGKLGGLGPTVEIIGPKPAGMHIKVSVSVPFLGQFSQPLLVSQDARGMIMVMPATSEGEVDQNMVQQLGLPPGGFRSMDEMAAWMATNLPAILSSMLR